MDVNKTLSQQIVPIGYGLNGKNVDPDSQLCFCKKVGETCYIRQNTGQGQGIFYNPNLGDPMSDVYRKFEKYPFKKVRADQFEFYLQFLKKHSESYLRQAEREQQVRFKCEN